MTDMPMHTITRDGYSTVIKTTVEHSPEFWRMIDRLFALDGLIDVRDPTEVADEIEFAVAAIYAQDAIRDYAASIAPGSAGDLNNALRSHLDRIRFEAADKADVEWVA
jgi:hypothetical protein